MLSDEDFRTNGRLFWHHSMPTTMPIERSDEPQPKKTMLKNLVQNKLIGGKAGAEEEFDMEEDGEEQKDRDADSKPDVLYANDWELREMVMVVLGTDGQQHHVY